MHDRPPAQTTRSRAMIGTAMSVTVLDREIYF